MQLLDVNINKYLLLEGFKFTNPNNNIESLNKRAALTNSLEEQLLLLNIATQKIEKFHSFFHFEQSFFHLQLALYYLNKDEEKAKQQLELAIFQDHNNQQAIAILGGLKSNSPYQRIYINFNDYLKFATEETAEYSGNQGYWNDWENSQDKETIENIIEKIRHHHLNYHQESAKLYLNRAIIFHALKQDELSKNDLIKANNLDSKLKEKDYYPQVMSQIATQVVLGLGSNLGDRNFYLNQAIEKLQNSNILIDITRSSIEETKAVLKPNSPKEWNLNYLNMAIKGFTMLNPSDLLKSIKDIEHAIGRKDNTEWAPREIDIDILAYGEEVIELEDLKIPHPLLLQRPWALKPFTEIYPEWKYPAPGLHYQLTIREIYEKH